MQPDVYAYMNKEKNTFMYTLRGTFCKTTIYILIHACTQHQHMLLYAVFQNVASRM